ncbi:hypothetical protein RCCGE510_12571 [Rhizobium sp. CCGE 510]|nr:hypothetical protein RCCGE510_12571 [Rhizobium sp. CCGE 510]
MLDGIDLGASTLEYGGVESPFVKGAGKTAGTAGMLLDIRSANQNLGKKWQTGASATVNDFAPYAAPLLLLNPAGEAVLLAYGAYKISSYAIAAYDRQQTPNDYSADPNQEWQKGIQAEADAARKASQAAEAAALERLKRGPTSIEINSIDPNNFHTDTFSVERPPITKGSDKWKTLSMTSSDSQEAVEADDLNICESFPGLDGEDWGEAFGKDVFGGNGNEKSCEITSRDDVEPSHKRYAATCTTLIVPCGAIYCYPDGQVPKDLTPQRVISWETLDLTRTDETHITELYETRSSAGGTKLRFEYEQCSE